MTSSENIELELLLEAIYETFGYDFRDYAMAHLKRRIQRRVELSGLSGIAELRERVLHEEDFFPVLLADLSIHTTEMYRDPSFYQVFRTEVIPVLRTYPSIRIWHAGCSTGEEVYSMAILLKEEGLYERTQIYATDLNENALQKARDGIYPLEYMKEYSASYQKAGGRRSLSAYVSARYGSVVMDRGLKENIVYATHNLATDGVLGEMQAVVCRNVLIYFSKKLQERACQLFRESLVRKGFLCLGTKETLEFSVHASEFDRVGSKAARIYRKRN